MKMMFQDHVSSAGVLNRGSPALHHDFTSWIGEYFVHVARCCL